MRIGRVFFHFPTLVHTSHEREQRCSDEVSSQVPTTATTRSACNTRTVPRPYPYPVITLHLPE